MNVKLIALHFVHLQCLSFMFLKLYRGHLGMCHQTPHRKPRESNPGPCLSATVPGAWILSNRKEHVCGKASVGCGNVAFSVQKRRISWHSFCEGFGAIFDGFSKLSYTRVTESKNREWFQHLPAVYAGIVVFLFPAAKNWFLVDCVSIRLDFQLSKMTIGIFDHTFSRRTISEFLPLPWFWICN